MNILRLVRDRVHYEYKQILFQTVRGPEVHAALLELLKTFNYGMAGSERVGEKASSLVRRLRDLATNCGVLAELVDPDDDYNGIQKSRHCDSLYYKVLNGPFYELQQHFHVTALGTDDYQTHKKKMDDIVEVFKRRYGKSARQSA